MTDPMSIPELAVQPRPVRTISRLLEGDAMVHALMFSGDPGNGPEAAAMWVAAHVIAPGDDSDPQVAAVRQRVTRGVHPDVITVRAEGVDLRDGQINNVVEQIVRKPFEAGAQVAVIHDAHTLSTGKATTANRLLKTLEEPPGKVVFILLANRSEAVLPTIRSRAIEVAFPPIGLGEMVQYLQQRGATGGLPPEAAARLSRGSMVRATELASGGQALERRAQIAQLAAATCRRDVMPAAAGAVVRARCEGAQSAAIADAEAAFEAEREQLSKDEARKLNSKSDPEAHPKRAQRIGRRALSDETDECLAELASWYRDLMAVHAGAATTIAGVDMADDINRLGAGPNGELAVHALDAITDVRGRLRVNVNLETALQSLFTELDLIAAGRVTARRSLGTTLV